MNNIGLIIWGCKGGYKVFCDNGVVDVQNKDIVNTIKDIRSFVRFNVNNLTTYAVEFTADYKVFTIYRSCNDNGTGAFVAMSVYVPHLLKVNGIRTTLDVMMDSYFREYVHPVFGTYFSDKLDDIEPFNAFIEQMVVVKDYEHKYSPSAQNDRPLLKLYVDVNEVDNFFDTPYRKEFFRCQEVMFMSKDIYDKIPETLRFNFPETIIDSVSDQEELPKLYVGNDSCVTNLKINGKVQDISGSYRVNSITTNVEICLKKKYCLDNTISGNLAGLINEGKFVERDGKIFLGAYQFVYKDFPIQVLINGQPARDGKLFIIEEENKDYSYIPNEDSEIKVKGNRLGNKLDVYLVVDNISIGNASEKPKTIKVHSFMPSNNVDNGISENINLKVFDFKVSYSKRISDDSLMITIPTIGDIKVTIPESGKTISLLLPNSINTNDLTNTIAFHGETNDTQCEWNPQTKELEMSKKILKYELKIPENIKKVISNWDFTIDGITRKEAMLWGMTNFFVRLSNEDEISNGILTINGDKYRFEVDSSDYAIVPKLLYVELSDNGNYEYKIRNTLISTSKNEIFPLDNLTNDIPFEYSNQYEIKNENSTIVIIKLKKNGTESSVYEIDIPEKCQISFRNCSKFVYYDKKGQIKKINNDKNEVKLSSDKLDIYSRDGKRKQVTIFKDSNCYKSYRSKDEQNGFYITYYDNGKKIIVEYKKEGIFNRILAFFQLRAAKIILLSMLTVAVCAVGVRLLWLWRDSHRVIATYKVIPATSKYGEKIKGVQIPNVDFLKSRQQIESNEDIWYIDVLNRDDVTTSLSSSDDLIKVEFESANNDVVTVIKQIKSLEISGVDTTELKIKTPIQSILGGLEGRINNSDTSSSSSSRIKLYRTYYDSVSYSTQAVTEIFNKAINLLSNDNDTADYITFLDEFKKLGNQESFKDTYQSINGRLDSLRKIDKANNSKKELQGRALNYKNQLQSDNCDANTLNTVEQWWKQLSEEQKQNVREGMKNCKYYFDNAIPAYKTFFTTDQLDEMKELLNDNNKKSVFSKNQINVINAYCKSTDDFKKMRKQYENVGKNVFKEPISKSKYI